MIHVMASELESIEQKAVDYMLRISITPLYFYLAYRTDTSQPAIRQTH
jgi:hypothetical protein